MSDAHMIRDDVGDHPHVPFLQFFRQRFEGETITDFRIEARRVGDVVTVHTAGVRH